MMIRYFLNKTTVPYSANAVKEKYTLYRSKCSLITNYSGAKTCTGDCMNCAFGAFEKWYECEGYANTYMRTPKITQ